MNAEPPLRAPMLVPITVSTLQRPFKLGNPPTETGLVPIGQPQLAAPAIKAECIIAFVGKCKWPNEGDNICVSTTEIEQERGASLGGGGRNKENHEDVKKEGPDKWISSAHQEEKLHRKLSKEAQLLPGERLGWWSEQKLDRRVRMRTLVNGAVNNTRTRISLDTGANVSIIAEQYARSPTTTHEPWIRRTETSIPLGTKFHKDRPTRVRLTNLSDRLVLCPTHLAIVAWVPVGTPQSKWEAYDSIPSGNRSGRSAQSSAKLLDGEVDDLPIGGDLTGSKGMCDGIISVAISRLPTAGMIGTAPLRDAADVDREAVHNVVASCAKPGSELPGCSPSANSGCNDNRGLYRQLNRRSGTNTCLGSTRAYYRRH
ncbi:unnamed protein product [Phytophthora fragariaefolia]|uniref:Unnamed protein product n=1 Tax=Phytophthora fragariaefolia TaxID=1490495 RepID=A0A9W6U718_9STRA|nr:unnamed protein product [Phytophthora fragariaefolia]